MGTAGWNHNAAMLRKKKYALSQVKFTTLASGDFSHSYGKISP